MSKFKVGDKVRCVLGNPDLGLHRNSVHTVVVVYPAGNIQLNTLDTIRWASSRFELVEPNPVLTPEEVFEHLRKGTKLEWAHKATGNWCNHSGDVTRIIVNELLDYSWRVKPEPEVIELNGKRYKLIEE